MKKTNPLTSTLEGTLTPAGFRKKSGSWFRTTDEVVEVVNLQKSQYGDQYYLNFAVWIRALGEDAFPKEEKCHIRLRGDAIVSAEESLKFLLDLDSDIAEAERTRCFAALLASEILPFAEECRSVNGLRSLFQAGRLKRALIYRQAKTVLTSPTE